MPSRIEVVQRIEHKFEALKPFNIELRIFDVGMVRLELDVWVEFGGALFCDLDSSMNKYSPIDIY